MLNLKTNQQIKQSSPRAWSTSVLLRMSTADHIFLDHSDSLSVFLFISASIPSFLPRLLCSLSSSEQLF